MTQHHSAGEQSFGNGGPSGSKSPMTDPSFLTTQQLLREMESLKDLVFTRLDAMDKAMELFNANITRVPTETDKQISQLKELHDEKFESVQTQFAERDTRSDKLADLGQKALDAALLTAEKAVGKQSEAFAAATAKSETSFTKQIDAIVALLTEGLKRLDEKIALLNQRLDRGEGKTDGHNEIWGYIVGAIGLLIGAASIAIHLVR